MNKFDELLKELKALELRQTGSWDEDLYETHLWNKYFEGNYKVVEKGLNVDKHRWYELSTTVVEIFGGFIGIHKVSEVFSPSMDIEDCCHDYIFFEMEAIPTITYREKKFNPLEVKYKEKR